MPTRRRSKEDVLTEFRRAELLASARSVFGTHGFESATMDAIAHQANVAKGTIYLYYPSKQAIYEAAFLAGMAELETVTKARVEAAGSIQSALAEFVATRAEYFREQQDFFRMYVHEISTQVAAGSKRRSACDAMVQRQTRLLEQVIVKAVAGGQIRKVDTAATALAVFDITRGLVARHLFTQAGGSATRAVQRARTARDVEFLMDLIWTGLKPPARKQKS